MDVFGIRDEGCGPGDDARGIPRPGILRIDEADVHAGFEVTLVAESP